MGFVLGQLYVYSNLSIYHTLANVMLSVIPQVGIGESFSGFFLPSIHGGRVESLNLDYSEGGVLHGSQIAGWL